MVAYICMINFASIMESTESLSETHQAAGASLGTSGSKERRRLPPGGLSSESRRAGSKSSGVAVSKAVDDLAQEFLQALTWHHLEPLDCVTENICSTHTVRVHG